MCPEAVCNSDMKIDTHNVTGELLSIGLLVYRLPRQILRLALKNSSHLAEWVGGDSADNAGITRCCLRKVSLDRLSRSKRHQRALTDYSRRIVLHV